MAIKLCESGNEIAACFPVMKQLRTELSDANNFIVTMTRLHKSGYQLVSVTEDGSVRCVAGFHLGENLAWGKFMYIDDLVTDEKHRSEGHGKKLMDWLKGYAKEQGCKQIHLDSRFIREDAHRFYLDYGMSRDAYHFDIAL